MSDEIQPHGDPDPIGILRAAVHSALGALSNDEPLEAERVLQWAWDLTTSMQRLEGVQDGVDTLGLGKLVQDAKALQGRVGALRDRVCGDDNCCHRTRLAGAGCPMGRECPYVELRVHRSFTTKWSEEDGAFVGLCDQFPLLSWMDADEGKTLAGIMGLVARMESENE